MNFILTTEILGDIFFSSKEGFSGDIPIFLAGREHEPFVFLEEKSITDKNVDAAERFLNCLEELFLKGKKELLAEATDNEIVKSYLEFLYDEMPVEVAKECDVNLIDDVTYRDIIEKMMLSGVSLNLNEYGFLVLTLDYVLGKKSSEEPLSVIFDENSEIVNITHEK